MTQCLSWEVGIEHMKVKVTVVVPVYNAEKYLRDCLESALKQSLHEVEIVCIDDCSQDMSGDILDEYARRDDRIIIIRNVENIGVALSRNRGLDAARGKYICFLDADDFLKEDALKELYEIAEEKQTDIVFYNLEMWTGDCEISQEEMQYCTKGNYSGVMTGREFFREIQAEGDERVPVWLQFWRKESIEKYKMRFPDGIVHEDILFTYRGLMEAKRVCYVNKAYYVYRRHKGSITMTKINDTYICSLLEVYTAIMNYWEAHRKEAVDDITERYLCDVERKIIRYLVETKETMISLRNRWGENSFYTHWLRLIVYRNLMRHHPGIDTVKLLKLLQSPGIIVYGAGKVAQRYIGIMQSYRINIIGVAVSDKTGNPDLLMGIPVYAVEDLTDYCEKYSILIAVGRKHQDEVIQKIKQLGFENYELWD